MKPLLAARDLSYAVDGKYLVKNLNFTLQPGEFLTVIGCNGAGKTTLLRLLTGDLRPTSGEVQVFDKALREHAPRDLAKRRAVLAQSTVLEFAFEVLEVVMLGRTPHARAGSQETDLRISEESLEKIGMKHFARRSYPTLSGGEQQRVQMARTLAQIARDDKGSEELENDARLLFMDEPTSSLDIPQQHRVLRAAKELCQTENVGVLSILHDMNLAARYADKVLVLRQGEGLAFGTPEEVLTENILREAFQYEILVSRHPQLDCKLIIT